MAPHDSEQALCVPCCMMSKWHGTCAEDDGPEWAERDCCRPAESGATSSRQERFLQPGTLLFQSTPEPLCPDLPGDLGLDLDLWRLIISYLPIESLPAAAAVCKHWRGVIKDPEVWASSFRSRWKLKAVHGEPMSRNFWRGKLGQFVVAHRLQPEDSVMSLAIKFGVEVTAVKRQNNIISDHSIYARERLLIPVPDSKYLEGKECFIETDKYSRREVAVIYAEGKSADGRELQEDEIEKQQVAHARDRSKERFREKMVETLRKGLKVDDATARYYLAQNGWDLRGAYAAYQVDAAWESQRPTQQVERS